MEIPELDTAKTIEHLTGWLREQFAKSGFEHAVIGLSGGIDSALTCSLACAAIGREKVQLAVPLRVAGLGFRGHRQRGAVGRPARARIGALVFEELLGVALQVDDPDVAPGRIVDLGVAARDEGDLRRVR